MEVPVLGPHLFGSLGRLRRLPARPEPSRRAAVAAVGLMLLVMVGTLWSSSSSAAQRPVPEPEFVMAPEPIVGFRVVRTAPLPSAEALVQQVAAEWPRGYRRSFLEQVAPAAIYAGLDYCVPPSVTIAQAVQESGWGRSELARTQRNLFGVKAGSRSGVAWWTREGTGQELQLQRFLAYTSPSESVRHHNRLLAEDERYAPARQHRGSWRPFLEALAPVYASDPAYVEKVAALIEQYRLDRWDALVLRSAQQHGGCEGPSPEAS